MDSHRSTPDLIAPFLADGPEVYGVSTTSQEELEDLTSRALQAGLQVATHAIGDRSNRITLDACEAALAAVQGPQTTASESNTHRSWPPKTFPASPNWVSSPACLRPMRLRTCPGPRIVSGRTGSWGPTRGGVFSMPVTDFR